MRVDLGEALRLARRELPRPMDVVNLIRAGDERRFERYRWYGLLVAPLMLAAGARVRWAARHERSLHGEPQADKLLVVRYPSHRRFVAMTVNPYYMAINRLREAGIDAFEASFTHASVPGEGLPGRRRLLVAHWDGAAPARVAELMPGELVYATRRVADISYADGSRPTDPRPLRYRHVAFFDGEPEPRAAAVRELERVTGGISLQLYRREALDAYRPRALGGARR